MHMLSQVHRHLVGPWHCALNTDVGVPGDLSAAKLGHAVDGGWYPRDRAVERGVTEAEDPAVERGEPVPAAVWSAHEGRTVDSGTLSPTVEARYGVAIETDDGVAAEAEPPLMSGNKPPQEWPQLCQIAASRPPLACQAKDRAAVVPTWTDSFLENQDNANEGALKRPCGAVHIRIVTDLFVKRSSCNASSLISSIATRREKCAQLWSRGTPPMSRRLPSDSDTNDQGAKARGVLSTSRR